MSLDVETLGNRITDGKMAALVHRGASAIVNDMTAGAIKTAVRLFRDGGLTPQDALLCIAHLAAYDKFLSELEDRMNAGERAAQTLVQREV